jgi:hypothetical protein
MRKLREEKGGRSPLLATKELKILILKTTNFFRDFSFESSKRVERGKRGGGGSLSLITRKFKILSSQIIREFRALSFKRVERRERGVDCRCQ